MQNAVIEALLGPAQSKQSVSEEATRDKAARQVNNNNF